MTNNNLKRSLVIGFIIIFVGASILPSISGNLTVKCVGENRGVLFEDDFDDNTIDHDKWSEFLNDGDWWEINKRTELQLGYSSGSISEGIQSIFVPVTVTQDLSIIISVDMITDVGGNIDAGELHFKVNDGQNWVWAIYKRDNNQLIFKDSNDPDWTTIGSRGDGTWGNEIKIYSDRYHVKLDGFASDWVSDSLFSSSSQINMELYTILDASSDDFIRIGFDNVIIRVENQPPNKPSKPSGPTTGKIDTSYTYKTSTTDPNDDQIWYMFDWDDDTPLEWDGPYDPGITVPFSHAWDSTGTYQIKVKAKDIYDEESDWSDKLSISIPKSRVITKNLFDGLFEQFPNILLLIKMIFQLLVPN